MSGKVGSAIIIFAYVIVLFVLVRPGSQGPTLLGNLTSGLALRSSLATVGERH
jgi:hypothetical protein